MGAEESKILGFLFLSDCGKEQGSEKETARVNTQEALSYAMAEVNTLKRPYVRLLPDKWKTRTYY